MKYRTHLLSCLIAGSAGFLACGPILGGADEGESPLDGWLAGGASALPEDSVLKVLRRIFPDLTDEDLKPFLASLDLEAAFALEMELSKVRESALEFSAELFQTAEERVETREKDLKDHGDAFPDGLGVVESVCFHDAKQQTSRVSLSGVFDGKVPVMLESSQVQLTVDGEAQAFDFHCLAQEESVDVVFLIDTTGSMSNVIASVRDSVKSFIEAIASSGLRGTVSVVSYQDSVGVNVSFQEPAPDLGFERSPFFTPVSLEDAKMVGELQRFVARLEANQGADAPENLAAAVDFAANSVVGLGADGKPNLIGDGVEDPPGTAPFPALNSQRQVFVALTDVTFHGAAASPDNSSLMGPFVPRDPQIILNSLLGRGAMVHVSDPSWVDEPIDPAGRTVDADFFAQGTGGLGVDRVLGYSLLDLELLVVAEKSGLFDIALDGVLGTTCFLEWEGKLSADAEIEITIEAAQQVHSVSPDVVKW